MSSLEAMSANLEHLELNKDSFTKSILTLALEWKDLDEHLDSIPNASNLGQKLADLEEKQRVLRSEQESLTERNLELDLVRESVQRQLEELESRELRFRSFQLAQIEELKEREEKLEESRAWVVERVKEFEGREEWLNEQEKSIQVLSERVEREMESFVNIEKSVEKKLSVIGLREMQCEDKCTEIDAIQEFVLGRVKELDSREEKVGFREEKVEALHTNNEQIWKEHEMTFRDRSVILDSAGDLLRRKAKELGDREKQIELREMQIKAIPFNEEKLKELEVKVKDGYRVLDSVRDLADKLAKELDSRGRKLAISKFLGLQERLYDYIRELIRRGQHLNAIGYVCLFEIKDDFPPGSLVKGYITYLGEAVEKICKEGQYSFKAQEIATKKELNAFKELIKRIKLHKLDSEYSLESAEERVEQLQTQMANLQRFSWSPPAKAQPKERASPEREKHTKKRKGFEYANNVQITQGGSAENCHPDDIPQLPYEHQSLSPQPVPHNIISQFCLVGSTSDPPNMGQCCAGALIQGGFTSSGVDLGTNVEFPLFTAGPQLGLNMISRWL